MNRLHKGIASLLFIFVLPALGWGCFQVDERPIKYFGDQLKVNFSYERKPLSGAYISLFNKQTKKVSLATANKQGWASFTNVPGGKYKLTMDGPSHESFDVEFTRTAWTFNSIYINFYADYCHSISIHGESAGSGEPSSK